jgi:hypothetical protein
MGTHSAAWYHALAVKLGHIGYVTLAEIRKAESENWTPDWMKRDSCD